MSGWMMNPYQISNRRQYYRLITSGFIHNDHMHLLWNMFAFYFFGTAVENDFGLLFGGAGRYYFLVLYLSAIVVSDLPTYFKQKDNILYNALGASGGVGAVIFVFILLEPLQEICLYFALCMKGFIFGLGYMLYSYYQRRNANDNINHDAHLFGALYGLFFCVVVHPSALIDFYRQVNDWMQSLL